jgi:hypothetical protein
MTAHDWHCLAGIHHGLHRRQIERIKQALENARVGPEVAPNFHPVAASVWQLLPSYTVAVTGQGAEPWRSAAPWPCGGEKVAA